MPARVSCSGLQWVACHRIKAIDMIAKTSRILCFVILGCALSVWVGLKADGNADVRPEADRVRAQLAESLPLIRVPRVHQELGITGLGIGILVVDDWAPQDRGYVHGQAVVDVIRAVAPGARLWLCQLDFSRVTELDFVFCLQRIARERLPIRLVNLSFSIGDSLFAQPCDVVEGPLAQTIRQLHESGVVFVAASGNDGRKGALRFPACLPEVISVGATYDLSGPVEFNTRQVYCRDRAAPDRVTCYSNVADYLDLVAPGTLVSTPAARNFGGTSAAAPLVTGVMALMLEAQFSRNGRALLRELQATAVPALDPAVSRSFPRIDAYRAVQAALSPEPSPVLPTVAQFDINRNGVIEDFEFFTAIDHWIADQISNDLFFGVIDEWVQQRPITVSGNPRWHSVQRIGIFDLQGKLIVERESASQRELDTLTQRLANGVYMYVVTRTVEGRTVREWGRLLVLR
jgi:hypothetical protein